MLERLIVRNLRSGSGVISLSSRDLGRMTADFEKKLSEKASEKCGTVSISKEPADIQDGFILTYGNISENCSFSAMIETDREDIKDLASRELFGGR